MGMKPQPMCSERWEYGSKFPLLCTPVVQQAPPYCWAKEGSLWGAGRDALRALVSSTTTHGHWRRIWCPSYFCTEVTDTLAAAGLEICRYPDAPNMRLTLDFARQLGDDDVILVMNYFGLRERPSYREVSSDITIVEDHSHDLTSPWVKSSRADWCIASLRKTLPVPDGGVIWSPKGHDVPFATRLTPEHECIANQRLASMALKSRYLRGHRVSKRTYRHLSNKTEAMIGKGIPSSPSHFTTELLESFPLDEWRSAREANFSYFAQRVRGLSGVELLEPESLAQAAPAWAALNFESPQLRTRVRQRLIEQRIYPSVLWPIVEHRDIPAKHVQLSQRLLLFSTDMRYESDDLDRVCHALQQSLRE